MSDITLYNLLKRIPDATDEEVQRAVADVANSADVATKADIKDMATKTDIAELKAETKANIAELKTELLEKIAEVKHTMIIWFIGVSFANAAIMITLLKFFSS